MNNFVKGALIFTGGVAGGFVLCGITITRAFIMRNRHGYKLIFPKSVSLKTKGEKK